MSQSNIRNFCIIAHIDHGKSTLADRLLEATGTVAKRDMQEQLLDSNPIERERGITIKLAPVRMIYHAQTPNSKLQAPNKFQNPISNIQNKLEIACLPARQRNWKLENSNSKQEFVLNLIDTPGHIDFNYEVSRSLAACEGALLIVDATQGVQAQTLANLYLARKQKLTIIPIINKIDLPNALVEETKQQLVDLGFKNTDIISISAKFGTNISQVLKAIIERIPSPKGEPDGILRALVFSSQYDVHKGVVVYVRIVDGFVSAGPVASFLPVNARRKNADSALPGSLPTRATRLKFLASNSEIIPIEIGYFIPQMKPTDRLNCGEVGYIATGLKDVNMAKVGDTVTAVSYQSSAIRQSDSGQLKADSYVKPLPGYKEPKPMVFLGLYPIESDDITKVRDALGKLKLSDSAFSFKPISSLALGNGFHCGFLGLLHGEIVQERLAREFNLNLLATAPTVEYRIKMKHDSAVNYQPSATSQSDSGQLKTDNLISIQSAAEFPDPSLIESSFEPIMKIIIFSPKKYVGVIMQLCQDKRGEYIDLVYVSDQAKFTYLIPLSEMIIDFFDRLKSLSQGYASLDYEFFDYQQVDLVKLDILLNHEKVDAFSQLVVKEKVLYLGKLMVDKLKDVIPRHQFAVPIQATIGGQIIARSDVKPFRKDVIQKLYGGDRTRKDKLLEAQKKGKKRMKQIGKVEIPQDAFLAIFKRD